jgi:hypothetical protein
MLMSSRIIIGDWSIERCKWAKSAWMVRNTFWDQIHGGIYSSPITAFKYILEKEKQNG